MVATALVAVPANWPLAVRESAYGHWFACDWFALHPAYGAVVVSRETTSRILAFGARRETCVGGGCGGCGGRHIVGFRGVIQFYLD